MRQLTNLANAVGPHESEPVLLRAIELGEAAYGRESYEVSIALANLGSTYMLLDRFEEARALYVRVIEIEERTLGSDHQEVAGSYANLGGALIQLGDIDGAAPYFDRGLAIARQRLDADHPLIAQLLHNRALVHAERGELEAALEGYRAAAPGFGKEFGAPESYANSLGLAAVLRRLGRLDEAEQEIGKARALHDALEHPMPWFPPSADYELGMIDVSRGEHARALERFERALAIEDPDTLPAARIRFALAMSRIATAGPSAAELASARAAYADLERRFAAKYELEEAASRLAVAAGPLPQR
jgi:tetratricopeptide (TPR) repeat protein